jgi:hypothetical protein
MLINERQDFLFEHASTDSGAAIDAFEVRKTYGMPISAFRSVMQSTRRCGFMNDSPR